MILTNLIRQQQARRSTPCILVASPDGVTEQIWLSDLENASNRAASFLQEEVPKEQEIFLYMGPSDVRYFIWVLAAMKTERCVMLPSPGNTVPSNQRLLETVGAKTLLYAPEAEQSLAPLLHATKGQTRCLVTPSYAELMSKEAAAAVHALCKPFELVESRSVLGLHTSGTSGHPKPIYWTHGSIAALGSHSDAAGVYPESFRAEGKTSLLQEVFAPGEVVMMPFPLYHMGGMSPAFFSVLYGNTHVIPATGTQMTSENISGMLRHSKCTTAWLAPSLLENMLDSPAALETLATMKHVVFGGGPMNPEKGERLSKLVPHLCGFIGSTEGGACHLLSPPDSSHWNEFNFIDVGQKMEAMGDGLFELIYPNTEGTRRCQLYFHSHPQLSEYRTKDLFRPVAGKPGWWTYYGRTDNWVILSNALKMDPTHMENAVGSHPDVSGVLVAGDRRYRPCLLVELKDEAIPRSEGEKVEVMTRLWPCIEAANASAVKFGRIPRELVLFATREKPFLRASKGTIQRRLTIEAHADEIHELYAKAEQGLLTDALPPLETLDEASLSFLLRYLYTDLLELDTEIGIDDNLLDAGVDSIGAMTISSRLKAAFRQHGIDEARLDIVSVKNIYSASTIRALAGELATALSSSSANTTTRPDNNKTRNQILALIHKYNDLVRNLVKEALGVNSEGNAYPGSDTRHTVLLTGSTGSLGSYLLHTLLARPDIGKVICLNRGSDASQRQTRSLASRKLSPLLQDHGNEDRAVFVEADLKSQRLGLSEEDYARIASETTIIIHNAYPVNFLMDIAQFEPHLLGLLNLIQLSLRREASLMFVSSISTVMSATAKRQQMPETILDPATQVDDLLPQGYAQSKYVCEQMLQTFSSCLPTQSVPVSVLRVGQICGPRLGNGPWNKWEWFPSLVMSSRFLGVAPNDIGQDINWVPVDELARIVSDLIPTIDILQRGDGPEKASSALKVFNVVNPSLSSWGSILPALQAAVPETIPVTQWVARLQESVAESTYVLDQNPGAKLVEFYKRALLGGGQGRAKPNYAVDNLVKASPTAAKLAPVTDMDLKRWMDAWA